MELGSELMTVAMVPATPIGIKLLICENTAVKLSSPISFEIKIP